MVCWLSAAVNNLSNLSQTQSQDGAKYKLTSETGVTRDKLGEDTTSGLNTESQRADLNKDNILSSLLARKDIH